MGTDSFKNRLDIGKKVMENSFKKQAHPSPLRDCVAIPFLSLRATEGSVAISLFSIPCEIASVVSLPRNDIMTQSLRGEGEGGGERMRDPSP
jgi:hypothetical protein